MENTFRLAKIVVTPTQCMMRTLLALKQHYGQKWPLYLYHGGRGLVTTLAISVQVHINGSLEIVNSNGLRFCQQGSSYLKLVLTHF